jgi:hypothetical protein
MDYMEEAERHRKLAEEYRTMAECTTEDSLRIHYRNIAQDYEKLADNEAQIARNIRMVN